MYLQCYIWFTRNEYLFAGWNLKKHLLMVDEWRVCSKKIVTDPILMDGGPMNSLADLAKIIPFGDVISDFNTNETVDKEAYTIEPEMILQKMAEGSKAHVNTEEADNKTNKIPDEKKADDESKESVHIKKD